MEQRNRIHEFVSKLLDSKLSAKQSAVVLGEEPDSLSNKKKKKANQKGVNTPSCVNKECTNRAMSKCLAKNEVCVNYSACRPASGFVNALRCVNTVDGLQPSLVF
ncbi:MAG: hypothetical protein NC356_02550 [Ruminococcus sp.]|nr:hypothetical protein [Ruminococcus sp.]